MDRSKMAKRNRVAGQNYERKIMHLYRDAGFENTVTSRNESRILDNCRVDLANLPLYPQCKYGYKSMSVNEYIKIFNEMHEELSKQKHLDDKPYVIHHRKGRKKFQDLVVIPVDDYFKLLKQLQQND